MCSRYLKQSMLNDIYVAFRHNIITSDLPKSLSEIIIIFVLLFWISFIQTLNDNVVIQIRSQAKIIGRSLDKLFLKGYLKWSTGHKSFHWFESKIHQLQICGNENFQLWNFQLARRWNWTIIFLCSIRYNLLLWDKTYSTISTISNSLNVIYWFSDLLIGL